MSHPQFQTGRELASYNQTRPCAVSGCTERRKGMGKYCGHHWKRAGRYGHPLGRSLCFRFDANAREHLTAARRFVVAHAGHRAVQAACRFFGNWSARASLGENVPAARELARLHHFAVKPEECVAAVLAVWSMWRGTPHLLPDAERLDFATANALLQLAPRAYRSNGRRVRWPELTAGPRRVVGRHVRKALAPFLIHAADALIAEGALRQREADDLRAEFTPGSFETTKKQP